MSVNISIKNVPDHVAERLRRRAERNHRSLQGELMAILEQTVRSDDLLSPNEVLDLVRSRGLATPSDSAATVRSDRDARSGR